MTYAGYRPSAVDVTAFWRPRLQSRVGKFFYQIARRALKGVGIGLWCKLAMLVIIVCRS
jgi:hypothetical protein